MYFRKLSDRAAILFTLAAGLSAVTALRVEACGGFFCSAVPVNQNAEQIIFRQDGDQVAAFVRIQYQGAAEEFSWVVPVPGIPEVSTSSELLFTSLDAQTRPNLQLMFEGQPCEQFFSEFGGFAPFPAEGIAADSNGAVSILDEKVVGPFNVQIVRSDDPKAIACAADVSLSSTRPMSLGLKPFVRS